MKQKPTQANPFMPLKGHVCTGCGLCEQSAADKTKAIRGENKTLYHAEVLSYYFYFYHQLVAAKNGYPTTLDEWI